MANKLKEITYLTLKEVKKQEIVLPVSYSNVFQSNAKKLGVNLKNEELIQGDLKQDGEHIEDIIKKTNDSLTNINQSTSNARKAIKDKDDELLKKIDHDLAEMQKQINFLQKELFSDSLTKAYNRRWFSEYYLKDDCFTTHGVMVFIDLNKFKQINDRFGHIIGDQVLKYFVKFLQKEINDTKVDIVRFAGDEFILLFNSNGFSKLVVNKIMEELVLKLSTRKLKSEKIKEITFSFSYGSKLFKKGDDVNSLLEDTDKLMYEYKKAKH